MTGMFVLQNSMGTITLQNSMGIALQNSMGVTLQNSMGITLQKQHGHGQLAAMRGHVRFAEDTEQQTVERGQVFPQHVVDQVSIIGAFTFFF